MGRSPHADCIISQFYSDRSPLQNLFLLCMGVENTIYALHDHPKRIEEFARIAGEAQDQMYEVLAGCPVSVLNFGENIDGYFDSPGLSDEYFVPYYKQRVAQLHRRRLSFGNLGHP